MSSARAADASLDLCAFAALPLVGTAALLCLSNAAKIKALHNSCQFLHVLLVASCSQSSLLLLLLLVLLVCIKSARKVAAVGR